MKREWKEGDVALIQVTSQHGPEVAVRGGGTWGQWYVAGPRLERVEVVRPLVVIDAEDREQVERLLSRFLSIYDGMDAVASAGEIASMQAALREFANLTPPKPEEPTGLGAVVEAINDNHFVRVGSAGWVHVDDRGGNACDWDDIAVVRVVSEGVQP